MVQAHGVVGGGVIATVIHAVWGISAAVIAILRLKNKSKFGLELFRIKIY